MSYDCRRWCIDLFDKEVRGCQDPNYDSIIAAKGAYFPLGSFGLER